MSITRRKSLFLPEPTGPLISRTPCSPLFCTRRFRNRSRTTDSAAGRGIYGNSAATSGSIIYAFDTKAEEWLKHKEIKVQKGDLAASYTKELKRYIGKYYEPFFKSLDVREVRTGHIDDFYSSLPEHLSTKTVKNILNALQNFFLEMYPHVS